MARKPKSPFDDLVAYRKSRGENQHDFWSRFGVTQSGGSRYESGRAVPLPTAMLMQAFAEGVVDDKALERLRTKARP